MNRRSLLCVGILAILSLPATAAARELPLRTEHFADSGDETIRHLVDKRRTCSFRDTHGRRAPN